MAAQLLLLASGLISLIPQVSAQTFTSCNPLNRTDCPADPALSTNATFNFTEISADAYDVWNTSAASTVDYTSEGADFVIGGQGDAPTLQSLFYLFFGQLSVVMKAASGQGIVTSIVFQSDDLDEVDWELIGSNNTHVQTNYFGKGNTTSYDRDLWVEVDDPQNQYHNYTYIWTNETLEWWIDDNMVRSLAYADALGGRNYPQTPMNVRIGAWAGGDPDSNSKGTVEWAGGEVNYDDAPFTMNVQSVYVKDFSSGKEYKYGDTSGSSQSIEVVAGTSTMAEEINSPHTVAQHFDALSTGAKIGIACGSLGFVVICGALLTFCCIKQRKAGRQERALADGEWDKEQAELVEYRKKMAAGDFGRGSRMYL